VAGGRGILVGGRKLSPELLKSLGIAPGMRALIWLSGGEVLDARADPALHSNSRKLDPLISEVQRTHGESTASISLTGDSEAFLAAPIERHGQTTAVLLAGTSLREQFALERAILWIGIIVGLVGIVIGVLLGWWTTERITRPVERLASG